MSAVSPQAQEAERLRKRANYLRRRASGDCLLCGHRPREAGRTGCKRCRSRQRRYELAKYRQSTPGASPTRCRVCGETDHNARTCPDKPAPACPRCGCRGEHVCLSTPEAAASRREWA